VETGDVEMSNDDVQDEDSAQKEVEIKEGSEEDQTETNQTEAEKPTAETNDKLGLYDPDKAVGKCKLIPKLLSFIRSIVRNKYKCYQFVKNH
jgi:hypothetical protein